VAWPIMQASGPTGCSSAAPRAATLRAWKWLSPSRQPCRGHDIAPRTTTPCLLRRKGQHVETLVASPPRSAPAVNCLRCLRACFTIPLRSFPIDNAVRSATSLLPRVLHHAYTLDVIASRFAHSAWSAPQVAARQEHAIRCAEIEQVPSGYAGDIARHDSRADTIEEREASFWCLVITWYEAVQ
jgi:hypothetical protein